MRIALFGLPKRAVQFIPKLVQEKYNVVAVFLSDPCEGYFPQIEALAEAYRIPCVYPTDPADPALPRRIIQLGVDLLVSVNFTKRLPRAVLECASRGAVNLHPSLLPKYRGPNPYFWVVRNGEKETGVTAHYMEESFDTGPILIQRKIGVNTHETLGSLLARLEALMEDVLLETLQAFQEHDQPPATAQDPAEATFAPQVKDENLRLDFSLTTEEILRHIRACNPAYGAWTTLDGQPLKIFAASHRAGSLTFLKTGTLIQDAGRPAIVTADGAIFPDVVLMENGGFYSAEQLLELGIFSAGRRLE